MPSSFQLDVTIGCTVTHKAPHFRRERMSVCGSGWVYLSWLQMWAQDSGQNTESSTSPGCHDWCRDGRVAPVRKSSQFLGHDIKYSPKKEKLYCPRGLSILEDVSMCSLEPSQGDRLLENKAKRVEKRTEGGREGGTGRRRKRARERDLDF